MAIFNRRFSELQQRIRNLEDRLGKQLNSLQKFVTSEYQRTGRQETQEPNNFGVYKALCIDTRDPQKQGRIRYFSPFLYPPDTDIEQLRWAPPISHFGGFDDCGSFWVPPAGSMVMLLFESGFPQDPFYIGTSWNRYRGPEGNRVFKYDVQEFYDLHEGHRKGYLLGPSKGGNINDESHVLPMWNTENYDSIDWNSISEQQEDPERIKIAYPYIMGWKTPQKHMQKVSDGDYRCHHRWKRMEWLSSLGNWMIFKDDWLHPAGQWAHPDCECEESGEANCVDENGEPVEKPEECPPDVNKSICANPYFKHENECQPYKSKTPAGNKAELPQSGVQIMSLARHSIILDDSVKDKNASPDLGWERSLEQFSWGCEGQGQSYARMQFKSATGHIIELNDEEKPGDTPERGNTEDLSGVLKGREESKFRQDRTDSSGANPTKNGILILTATGNRLEMNDDTNPGGKAGPSRGIYMESTSGHVIEMKDELNDQKSPMRMGGGTPVSKAKKAFIKIRSGYGLEMRFQDDDDQQETKQQYIQILAPQKDNKKRGAHIMRFTEKRDGPGQVLLRAGGDYIIQTFDGMQVQVGDPDKNPSDKVLTVSQNYTINVEEFYFNKAKTHLFSADDYIILAAGADCPVNTGTDPEQSPCLSPVLVATGLKQCPLFPNLLHPNPTCGISPRVYAVSKDPEECS
jgi:hypothetical protein